MSYFSEIIAKQKALQKFLDGEFYFAHEEITLASGTNREYLIKIGANDVMLFSDISVDGNATSDIYEGPTTSADGTSMTIYNILRSSGNTPNLTLFHTPTLSADGTLLEQERVFSSAGGTMEIGTIREVEGLGWGLAANTNYLIRVTNDVGGDEEVLSTFAFYPLP